MPRENLKTMHEAIVKVIRHAIRQCDSGEGLIILQSLWTLLRISSAVIAWREAAHVFSVTSPSLSLLKPEAILMPTGLARYSHSFSDKHILAVFMKL